MSPTANSKEVPMVRSYLKLMPSIEQEIASLKCQIKAVMKYHDACAKAAKKLAEDLEKCSRG
jgi:hypothetical protein